MAVFLVKEGRKEITADGFNYTITGCKKESQITREYKGAVGEIKIKTEMGSIILQHKLNYVCCADLKLDIKRRDNMISITEINKGEMCRCICEYNINALVGPLPNGNYSVKLYGVAFEEIEPQLIANQQLEIKESSECLENDDCVPATCCHPSECVASEKAPSCEGIMCTMVCQSILDCGQGYCACKQGKCETILFE